MSEAREPRTIIRQILANHLDSKLVFQDDTPLVSAGHIDSMSIVDLILDLQAEFGIEIPVSEVQPDDFDSVDKIAGTIARFQ